jgi:hypothetical protein
MKTLVIYHRADFDGLFCREIARKFLGDQDVTYVGWDYGDSDAIVPPGIERIYMLDISIERWMNDCRLIWIDHHKTAMDQWKLKPGYQIDGVAACRLAWQWFFCSHGPHSETKDWELPLKSAFVDRCVVEPWAVRLAGEYDIWDKRDSDSELFQHGLRSEELTSQTWETLLDLFMNQLVVRLLNQGRAVQYAKRLENEDVITSYGFTAQFEGLTFLCCNHARFNSHLFTAGIKPEHDALLGFKYTGKDWSISLYGVPGKPDIDLSAIAKKYGGGGHKQACGFRMQGMNWLLNPS